MAIEKIPFTYHGLDTRPNRELLFIKNNDTSTIQTKVNILRPDGSHEELAPLPNDKVTVRFECTASKVDTLTRDGALFFDRPLTSLSCFLQDSLLLDTFWERKVKILLSTIAGEESPETIEGVTISIAAGSRENCHYLIRDAATGGDIDVIKALMHRRDVDLNDLSEFDETALYLAVEHDQLEVVLFLLEEEEVDLEAGGEFYRDTPLLLAAEGKNTRILKALLRSKRLDVSREIDENGCNPLHRAVLLGDVEILQILLESNKFDINEKNDKDLLTPLHYAVQFLSRKAAKRVVRLLLVQPNIDVKAKTEDGRAALHIAAGNGDVAVMEMLLGSRELDINEKDNNGFTPLHYAVKSWISDDPIAFLLSQRNIDVTVKTNYGETIFHLAIQRWNFNKRELGWLLWNEKVEASEIINEIDHRGRTLLHEAAEHASAGLVDFLLVQSDIDANAKTIDGATALHLAARSGDKAIIETLLGSGKCDINEEDHNGFTPLDYAAEHASADIDELFLKYRASSRNVHAQKSGVTESLPECNSSSTSDMNVEKHCSGNHKKRLLIGEGNFSYALEMIRKHDESVGHSLEQSLGHSVVATELRNEIYCLDCKIASQFAGLDMSSFVSSESRQGINLCNACAVTAKNVNELEKKGTQIRLGVDGRKIHKVFRGKIFSRIHWNCPHDGSSYKEQSLPRIIRDFFKSCRRVQEEGGRVHITLAQPPDKKEFYQGYIYNIVRGASLAGYTLVKKREFSSTRYPGYRHRQTRKYKKASVTDRGMREFVFGKVGNADFQKARRAARCEREGREYTSVKKLAYILAKQSTKGYAIKTHPIYKDLRFVFDCTTDEDSSEYEKVE